MTIYKIRDKNTGLFYDNGREFDNLYKALQHSFGKEHLVVVKFEVTEIVSKGNI